MWWLLAASVGFAGFAVAALTGAPYVPILSAERQKLLTDLDLQPGQSLLDLGCGDGTMLVAAARQGVRAYGYEINPWLYMVALWRTRHWRSLVTIYFGNYWAYEWPEVDVVYVFLIGHYMAKLERQLARRLQRPTRIACYGFELPNVVPTQHAGAHWIYDWKPPVA